MTSFFRKKIAQKVINVLQQKQELEIPISINFISSWVKVNRFKSSVPKLILPWKSIERLCNQNISLSPNDLLRILRNQGLPTAEGFIDIELSESPLNLIFSVDKHVFSKIVLLDIYNNEDNSIKNSCLFEGIQKKNIVVQCGVPQIGEPLNLTHFRSLIHCNYVTNINRFAGHDVTKIAHVNDWGIDAAAFFTGYKKFNSGLDQKKRNNFISREVLKAALLEYKNDCKFKEAVDECRSKLEKGDPDLISEWQNLKQSCIEHYQSLYRQLGVNFDKMFYDSSYLEESKAVSSNLVSNNIISLKDGFLKINSCDELENNSYVSNIANIDSALYDLSRYIGFASEMKKQYNFDDMYYIAPSSLNDFLNTVFHMIKKLNYTWFNNLHPVSLKLITDFESKRRKRESMETVLQQVKNTMVLKLHENLQMELNDSLEEMAEHLGLSSLIVSDFKQKRNADYTFDWQGITGFQKDSGAAFQMCYAGLKRLQEESEYKITDNTDTSALLEPQAHHLVHHLARFDEMVYKSYWNLEPFYIVQYLSSLWYFTDEATNILKLDVKQDKLKVIKARLLLLSATLNIFRKGLYILGINPLKDIYSPDKPFVTNS